MALKLKKNYKKYLFLIPLSLFILDYIFIITGAIEGLDQSVYSFTQYFASESVTEVVIIITQLGGLVGILGIIVVVFLINRKIGIICLITSIFQQGINRVIKIIIQRPRPSVVHLVDETNYSFPSGHAMAITCLYGLLIYYLYQSSFKYRKLLMIGCEIIIILVLLSRVYLGVHYFSDVLGGFLLSLSLIMYISNIPSIHA